MLINENERLKMKTAISEARVKDLEKSSKKTPYNGLNWEFLRNANINLNNNGIVKFLLILSFCFFAQLSVCIQLELKAKKQNEKMSKNFSMPAITAMNGKKFSKYIVLIKENTFLRIKLESNTYFLIYFSYYIYDFSNNYLIIITY